jgi:hypothetical protein
MRASPRVQRAAGVGLENSDKKIAKILQIHLNRRKIAP